MPESILLNNLNLQAADYEQQIPANQRLRNGQYYTPSPVCDLMLALALTTEKTQRILEPSCGPGMFLTRAMQALLRQTQASPQQCLSQLHGIECDSIAANMAIQQLQALASGGIPNIHTTDFLTVSASDLGLFDVIIGNPPYVRQEHLSQSENLNKKALIQALQHEFQDYLTHFPKQERVFSQTADLYIWFFLKATSLLKPSGHLVFITSNSWLNTAYGQAFQQFLQYYFDIHYLIESACERWFPQAAINPLIIHLQKKAEPGSPQEEPSRLIRLQRGLNELLPSETGPDYWNQLQQRIRHWPSNPHISCKTQALPFPPTQGKQASNWAFALRAPKILDHLLKAPTCWQTLQDVGQVRYPIKTGINRFFYLNAEQIRQWRIEPEFLFPVIRSTRQITHYTVASNQCETFLFACPYTKAELLQRGKTGALAYIEWGETQSAPPRQKRSEPTPWPEVPSVKNHRPWHAVRPLSPPDLLCNRFTDQRFFFARCLGPLMEDQTFYGLTLHPGAAASVDFIAALLNSTLSYLLLEHNARTNLGEGVLQYARGDMAVFPVLNPVLYSASEQMAITEAFQTMCQRPIYSIGKELNQPDRQMLDQLILTPLLKTVPLAKSVESIQEQLQYALIQRVTERRALAKSVINSV